MKGEEREMRREMRGREAGMVGRKILTVLCSLNSQDGGLIQFIFSLYRVQTEYSGPVITKDM